jgi:hypothetical protein
VSVLLSFAVTGAMALGVTVWAQWLFASGRKLKP